VSSSLALFDAVCNQSCNHLRTWHPSTRRGAARAGWCKQSNRSGCPRNDDRQPARPQVYPILGSRIVHEVFGASIMIECPREKRLWTLTSLWTQRTRPQRLGKLKTVFNERPHPHLFFEKERGTKSDRQKQHKPTVHRIGSAPTFATGYLGDLLRERRYTLRCRALPAHPPSVVLDQCGVSVHVKPEVEQVMSW
jgi:hypothetical protein